MRKRDELTDPNSCMSKAQDDEMVFVLLGRDAAAPVAIRAWITERIRLGKNRPDDAQIADAERCARIMQAELAKVESPGISWSSLVRTTGANDHDDLDNIGI